MAEQSTLPSLPTRVETKHNDASRKALASALEIKSGIIRINGGGEGRGATLVQGKRKESKPKKEKPAVEAPKPAPVIEPKPQPELKPEEPKIELPPPAPVKSPEPKKIISPKPAPIETEPEKKPVPKSITISEVAMKHIDSEGKMTEVMEHMSQLGAHQLEEEQKKDWEQKRTFFTRFIPRFWHYTINHIGTLAKYKDHYAKAWAKAGFSATNIPYDFLKEVDRVANDDINENSRGGVKRFFGWIGDTTNRIVSGVTFTDSIYEKQRLNLLDAMSKVAADPNSEFAKKFLEKPGYSELFQKYMDVATGDYQASEAVAQRLTQDVGGQMLHSEEISGKEKIRLGEDATGPFKELRDFYLKDIITPLLSKGINGEIDQQTLLQLYKKMQALPFSKTFIDAYMDPNFSDESRRALQESLSYGNDLIKVVQEVLIPQLKDAKVHMESAADIENYLRDFVINVNTGTLRDGPRTEIGETFLEHAAARHITNERVHKLYEDLRKNGKAPSAVSAEEMRMANVRADFVGQHFARGVGIGLYTGAIGGGAWLASRALGKAGGIVSGGLIAGAIRGYGEWRMTGKEIQLHRLENALGYTFDDAAKRRRELNGALLPSKEMTPEITVPMKELTKKINEGSATDKETQELLGRIADVSARYELMDTKNIDLFDAQNSQAYQQEQIQMDLAKAEAKVALKNLLGNKPEDLRTMATAIGVSIPANVNRDQMLDYVLNQLQETFVKNLTTGMGLDSNLQTALGAYETADQRSSIDARNSAARRIQLKRSLLAGGSTTLGIFGGFLAHDAIEGAVGAAVHVPIVGDILSKVGLAHRDILAAAGSHIPLGHGVDMQLPNGVTFHDGTGFVAADGSVLVKMPDSHLEMVSGHLEEVKNDGTHIVNVADRFKALGFNLQQDGTISEPIVTHGPGFITKLVDGHSTRIPAGTEWVSHGGAGHFDLVVSADHSKIVLGDATFDARGAMTVHGAHNLANFSSVDDPTSIATGGGTVVDTHWIDNLKDLKDHNFGGFNFRAINVSNPSDIQIEVTGASGKVTNSILHLNSATHMISIEAPTGNPITKEFVEAMQKAGFIKDPKEIYDHVFLDGNLSAPGHIGRVPATVLNQIYSAPGVKTVNFVDVKMGGNVKWLSDGGWGKPLGAITHLNQAEAVYVNYPDWKPIPMIEMVDGHQQLSINHFINAWENAKIIDVNHAQIIGGSHNGEIIDINNQPGVLPSESAAWINNNVGHTVLLDRLNRSVNQAPEGFLQWLKDMKEGHGDASQVFAETRLDPTDTKGVVMQFTGNAQWNSFADPSKVPGDFSKYAFQPDGSVRGWTHFVWVPKGGDVSKEAFSFANLAPTEKAIFHVNDPSGFGESVFNKLTKIDLTEDVLRQKPTFSLSGEVWKTSVPDWVGAPFIFFEYPRRTPEAPMGIKGATPIYTVPTIIPVSALSDRGTKSTKTSGTSAESRESLTRKRDELSDKIGRLAVEVEGIPAKDMNSEQKAKKDKLEQLLDERKNVEQQLETLEKSGKDTTKENLERKQKELLTKIGELQSTIPQGTKTENLTLEQIKTQKEIERLKQEVIETQLQIEELDLDEDSGEPDPETGIKDGDLKSYFEDFIEEITEIAKKETVDEIANDLNITKEQAQALKELSAQNNIKRTTSLLQEIYLQIPVNEIMSSPSTNEEILNRAIANLDSKDQGLTRKSLEIMGKVAMTPELQDIVKKVEQEKIDKNQPHGRFEISNDPRVREVQLRITKRLLKEANVSEAEFDRFVQEIYGDKLDSLVEKENQRMLAVKSTAVKKQLDRVLSEAEESVKIPEAKTLDQVVEYAAGLVRDGKYYEAMVYLKDEELAKRFGLSFRNGVRVVISKDLPKNIEDLNSMVQSFAAQNWYHPNSKSIELSDIVIYKPSANGQQIEDLDRKSYPKEMLQEVALVYLEEWTHALQDKKGTQLVRHGSDEIDVAAFMYAKGITPTNAFLLRYDRGYTLGKLEEIDDSLTSRPAFRNGVFVRLKGHENENWQVTQYDPKNRTFIIRDTQNRYAPVQLDEHQLWQENQQGVYPFQDVHDFATLFQKLQEMGNIYGTQQSFTAQELIELIKKVESKRLKTGDAGLPRSGGLRQKVAELAGELTVNPGMTMMIGK